MSVFYKPKGRAAEYIPDGFALNIYKGCTIGCLYCYNAKTPYIKDFHSKSQPKTDIVKRVRDEAPKYSGKKVFMPFLGDLFQMEEQTLGLSYQVLEIFLEFNIIPIILTKGFITQKYWKLLEQFEEGYFGVTLTSLRKETWKKWEPGASEPYERIKYLCLAKSYGWTGWVSLEPVINIEEALHVINATAEFVDHYKIGKINHFPELENQDWAGFVQSLKEKKINYYLKESLQKFDKK